MKYQCREDPLEKEMATYSNIPVWEISWKRSMADYSPWGHKKVRHNLLTKQQQYIYIYIYIYTYIYNVCVCVRVTDSLRCTPETNTFLNQLKVNQ